MVSQDRPRQITSDSRRPRRQSSVSWAAPVELGKSSARGGVITAVGSWVRFTIQLSTTVFLARLLGPAEYGIAAVIIAFSSVSGLLRDSGLSTFAVQRYQITPRIVSALHYASCSLGIIFALIMAAIGPWISSNYSDPRYTAFASVMALNFLFTGLSSIPTALLARNMNFRILAVIEVVSIVFACGTGIGVAVAGLGAWALVLQATVMNGIQALAVILVCGWRPGKPSRWREMRSILGFSNSVSAVQALNYVTSNVDNLIVATFFGTRAAGLYAQAYQLLILPLQQISGPLQRVFIPTLSRLIREPERFRKFFRAIVSVVAFTLWPAFAILLVYSDSIILVLFGRDWVDSVSIFRILVIVGFAQSIGYINSWLFIASGQVKRQTIWTFISKPFLIMSFVIGVHWGVHGMAASYAAACMVVVIPAFLIASKKMGLAIRDLLSPMLWPGLLTLVTFGFAAILDNLVPASGALTLLVLDLFASAALSMLVVLAVPPIRRQVSDLLRLVTHR